MAPASPALPHDRQRIVIAMSGGVDSSVAAALLTEAGHDVIGVTLQLYDHGRATGRAGTCCAGQDIHDARRVADRLGIPHYILDYESRFRDAVIQPFADSYARGETPIPCAACNTHIKFGALLSTARELGARYLATGHYLQVEHTVAGPRLYAAEDRARDQSYFLFETPRAELSALLFPLGGMTKPAVRALAEARGLLTAGKPDSQDICFVPSGRYADLVAKLRPEAAAPGPIVHIDGRELGRHDGTVRFTVGQRRGLGIADGEPLYVVRIDAPKRKVVVGPRAALAIDTLTLRGVNWLGDAPLDNLADDGLAVDVRIRSTAAAQPATLFCRDGQVVIRLRTSEIGVAKGQACVFYAAEGSRQRVLGGGWIDATARGDWGIADMTRGLDHDGARRPEATP
jgi:tRNA-specific 2-thiouridylase